MSNIKSIRSILSSKNIDSKKLNRILTDDDFKKLSIKERCEKVNEMNLPYGVLRCTSPKLLKETLGMDITTIKQVGMGMMGSLDINTREGFKEILTDTVFNIDSCSRSGVRDFGFFNDIEIKICLGDSANKVVVEDHIKIAGLSKYIQ